MNALRQKMTLDLPLTDIDFLEDISRKKGWIITIMPKIEPQNHDIPDVISSLLGAGEPIEDDDLNARIAYHKHLTNK